MADRPKYYVYALYDPRHAKPFYVGKGSGKRALEHERKVRAGKEPNTVKRDIIECMHRDGLDVDVRLIAMFWDEHEAYRYERELINEIDPVANDAPGIGRFKVDFMKLVFQCVEHKDDKPANRGRFNLIRKHFPFEALPTETHRKLWKIAEIAAQ